ncbi:MAG: beta-1,6-N-acetylglucosaminyltransferase [Pseudomonadota bacterium]
MTAAYVMLAHDNLEAAGALAAALACGGRPVAVHIDARAPRADVAAFDAATAGADLIRLPRRKCEWGMFSLVEATLDGVAALLKSDGQFSHIALVSGADLPLRPLAEFDAFLDKRPDTDLIEAFELAERRWIIDGLSDERFRLYHFVNWRRRPKLFDASVDFQRRLRIQRRLPKKLKPALGSQWWCLSRATLEAIMGDPQLPELKRFYRWCWIPDESFFQTLARRHGTSRIDKTQTLARFDTGGLPYVFHDDHAQLLGLSDHFFARKAHPRALRLRETCLARALDPVQSDEFKGRAPEEELSRAARSRTEGREHMISPARLTKLRGKAQRVSAWPYTVIGGVGDETSDAISTELTRRGDVTCHPRLFAPGEVRLHGGETSAEGCLPANPRVRDFWPDQFVINLARGEAGRAVAFCLPPEDRYAIGHFIAGDPGARVLWFKGAWALDLYRKAGELDGHDLAERAREAAAAERGLLALFRKSGVDLTLRSAADLIDDPAGAIFDMLTVANARASGRRMKPPFFAPPRWARARPFLRGLQKAGVEVEARLLLKPEDGE